MNETKQNIINMPEKDESYRKLLDEKFSSIHTAIDLQFENVNLHLKNIIEQTTKTNGRVTSMEIKVRDLELNENLHLGGQCPQAERFKKIETAIEEFKTKTTEDLSDYHWVKKNPKLSLGILVGSVLIVLFSYTGFMGMKDGNTIGQENKVLNQTILENQKMIKTIEAQLVDIQKKIGNK